MSIYDQCVQLTESTHFTETEECAMLAPLDFTNATMPSILMPDADDINSWMSKKVYYISDIHLEYQIVRAFPNGANDTTVESYVGKLAKRLFSADLVNDIKDWHPPIVIFGGDVAKHFNLAKIFYTEFVTYWDKLKQRNRDASQRKRYVYAILGNHELWNFNTLEECCVAYEELFNSLKIYFLNNTVTWFGEYISIKKVMHEVTSNYHYEDINKDDSLIEYERQMRHIHNMMIVGGIGFAGYNNKFNANNGIYKNVIGREQELEETKKWEKVYNQAIDLAKENKCVLIVLTHTPIIDWKQDQQPDYGCIYFNGHNHRDYIYHDDETNIHIFANNQIGYRNSKFQLKPAYIYNRINPFAGYADGFHEVKSSDYVRFYDYINERIKGAGLVERQIKNNNAKLYLIKHNGYYGFFLTSARGTYICAGGRIKKIGKYPNIEQFNIDFSAMVKTYLKCLSPYRNAQEQISEAIKAFGGNGLIHGCIIDIDFLNHVMLNPSDGAITYYNSPLFGQIKTYGSMLELLADNDKLLEQEYKKQLKLSETSENNVLTKSQLDITGQLVQIDIKNSIYAISNRMNQLQRLFDKKILRDWNSELLTHQEQRERKRLE